MQKTERFGLVLSPTEREALERLAEQERISAAAVIRRLIWRSAHEQELWPRQQISGAGNGLT
jgi:hypothetical protein